MAVRQGSAAVSGRNRLLVCAKCGLLRPHDCRGLCVTCYARLKARYIAGTSTELFDFDRTTWSRAEVVEEAELLADAGVSASEAVVRLGYRLRDGVKASNGLYMALLRAGRSDLWARLRANGGAVPRRSGKARGGAADGAC